MSRYAAVHAAFVAGMSCMVGIDFGAKLLSLLARAFEVYNFSLFYFLQIVIVSINYIYAFYSSLYNISVTKVSVKSLYSSCSAII